jgi:hypothetical protein
LFHADGHVQTDRQTDRQTRTNRQTDIHRQTDRQTDRQRGERTNMKNLMGAFRNFSDAPKYNE